MNKFQIAAAVVAAVCLASSLAYGQDKSAWPPPHLDKYGGMKDVKAKSNVM